MRRRLLAITIVLFLAGAALAAVGGCDHTPDTGAAVQVGKQVDVRFTWPPPDDGRSYEGRIKDVRPAWDTLILTVGEGKEARDMGFDIGYARIVGTDGDELKGQDLRIGDRVRVQLTADCRTAQQVRELAD